MKRKWFLVGSLLVLIGLIVYFVSKKKNYNKWLEGKWFTYQIYYNQDGYFRSDTVSFSISDTSYLWDYKSILYLDQTGFSPLFELQTTGQWALNGRTESSPDLQKLDIYPKHKYVTIYTKNDTDINAYYLQYCNAETNLKKEITASGCSVFPPISETPIIYQSVQFLDHSTIAMGYDRFTQKMNIEDKRPTKTEIKFIKKVKQ